MGYQFPESYHFPEVITPERKKSRITVNVPHILPLLDQTARSREAQVSLAMQFLLLEGGKLLINTGKRAKFLAWISWVEKMTGAVLVEGEHVVARSVGNEPLHHDAGYVAQFKVEAVQLWLAAQPHPAQALEMIMRGTEPLVDAMQQKSHLQSFLRRNPKTSEKERGALLAHALKVQSVGAGDVNVFLQDPSTSTMHALAKLERLNRPLRAEEVAGIYHKLKQPYCFPENGRIYVEWDIANHIQNGIRVTMQDRICVISEPLSLEIFQRYFEDAVYGPQQFIYKASPCFALMEALMENGGIRKVAVLPKEMAKKGITITQMLTTATPQHYQVLYDAAFLNITPRL